MFLSLLVVYLGLFSRSSTGKHLLHIQAKALLYILRAIPWSQTWQVKPKFY